MSVVVIGSSGGGTATLGHTNAGELLATIHNELRKIDCENKGHYGISHALYVSLQDGEGMDAAKSNPEHTMASLYSVETPTSPAQPDDTSPSPLRVQVVCTGSLRIVNEQVRRIDSTIARRIRDGQILGLICISCDVHLHTETLRAAAVTHIPVTGSGGSSLSAAVSQFGIRLVGNAGGSVATTSYTRALSYTHALAEAWEEKYRPLSSDHHTRPQWRSVLNSCLPAFWAVCVTCRTLSVILEIYKYMEWKVEENAFPTVLLSRMKDMALPTACCIVMASSCAPQHGSTAVLAASMASIVCGQSIVGGLLAGWCISILLSRILYVCIVWNIPATMSNLIAGGGVGVFVAITMMPIIPLLQLTTTLIREGIRLSMMGQVPGLGFAIGCLFCYGSKIGAYHSVFLPVILVEMERGEASVWGAIDECALVLVSAGICAANLLIPVSRDTGNSTLCRRGLRINLLYGDFIEAAYPYMEQHILINIISYIASGVSVEILASRPHEIMSSAYMPFYMSIWLAKDSRRMALACVSSFGISFLGTAINNTFLRQYESRAKQT